MRERTDAELAAFPGKGRFTLKCPPAAEAVRRRRARGDTHILRGRGLTARTLSEVPVFFPQNSYDGSFPNPMYERLPTLHVPTLMVRGETSTT